MINSVIKDVAFSVQVAARLANGSTDTSYDGDITLTLEQPLGGETGGATLGGTLTRPAVSGVALFDDLTIDEYGTGYRLLANSSGFRQIESNPFNVVQPGVPPVSYTDYLFMPSTPGDDLTALNSGSVAGLTWNNSPVRVDGSDTNMNSDESSLVVSFIINPSGVVAESIHATDMSDVVSEAAGAISFADKVNDLWTKYEVYVAAWIAEWESRFPWTLGGSEPCNEATDGTPIALPLSVYGGANNMHAMTVVGVRPASTPLNVGGNRRVVQQLMTDYVIDFASADGVDFAIAQGANWVQYTTEVVLDYSRITYPVVLTLSVTQAGLGYANTAEVCDQLALFGLDVNSGAGTVTCDNATELADALFYITDKDTFTGEAIRQANHTPSGTPNFAYVNLAGVQSSSSTSGLVVTTLPVTSPATWGDQLSCQFHDNSGNPDLIFDLTAEAAGLESAENITGQKSMLSSYPDVWPWFVYVYWRQNSGDALDMNPTYGIPQLIIDNDPNPGGRFW